MVNEKNGSIRAAKEIGIDVHRLYCWERYGIVSPTKIKCGTREFRRYSAEDINRGRLVRMLVDEEGYVLRAAVRKLKENKTRMKAKRGTTGASRKIYSVTSF